MSASSNLFGSSSIESSADSSELRAAGQSARDTDPIGLDIAGAESRIAQYIRTTPVLAVDDDALPGVKWFKCEYMQEGGSFKLRGAFNRLLATMETGELDPKIGVVAASGGNAGLAHAIAAKALGVPAHIFVHEAAPKTKVDAIRSTGAVLHQIGSDPGEAMDAALSHARETGAVFCHPYDQSDIVAGAGTIATEMLQQVDGPIDTIVVAVGGGGLMAGIAAAVPGTRVVGVEPESAQALHAALAAERPVDVRVGGIAADSLGARRVGDIAFAIAHAGDVSSVLVSDDAIIRARSWLWTHYRIVVEHGAAAAVAAIQSGAYTPAPGERISIVLCGANTDVSDLSA